MHDTTLKKWKLLSSQDVSPSPWFPIENRSYEVPDGKVVKDFFVTTLADVAHVVPVTVDQKIIMIRMYKQGTDDFMIQFPAGRFESKKHTDIESVALAELEEETGVKVARADLKYVGVMAVMSTKATEKLNVYLVQNVEINSHQHLDENEEIEVLTLSIQEVDQMIADGQIWDAQVIADWYLVKAKFPETFSKK